MIKKEASNVLRLYLKNARGNLEKSKVNDIRYFLKKLSENAKNINHDWRVYLEISKIEDDLEMVDWFCDNIEKFWI